MLLTLQHLNITRNNSSSKQRKPILSERTLIILSFLCIYFIWGSTFLATDWAFTAFPPFFLLGLRFILSGTIFLGLTYKRLAGVSRRQVLNAAGFGVLLIGLGTGGGMYSVSHLDTSVTALFMGMQPLLVVVFLWLLFSESPSSFKIIGVVLGLIGMLLLVSQNSIVYSENAWKGFLAVAIGLFSWSLGTVYLKQTKLPASNALTAAIQLLSGGLFLALVSLVLGENYQDISSSLNYKAIFALVYLIIFGSIIGYSAYNYLLLKVNPTQVSTVAFVNPVVAVFLGVSLNNEIISGQTMVAAIFLLSGVFFINYTKKKG